MKWISKDFTFKLLSTWYYQRPHWLHFSQVLMLMVLESSICQVYSIGGSAICTCGQAWSVHSAFKGTVIQNLQIFCYENSDLFWYEQYTKFADLRRMSVNISDITEKNVGYLGGVVVLYAICEQIRPQKITSTTIKDFSADVTERILRYCTLKSDSFTVVQLTLSICRAFLHTILHTRSR